MRLGLVLAALCLTSPAISDSSVAEKAEDEFGKPLLLAGLQSAFGRLNPPVVVLYADGRLLYRDHQPGFSYVRLTKAELAGLLHSLPLAKLETVRGDWAPNTDDGWSSFLVYYPPDGEAIVAAGHGGLHDPQDRARAPRAVAAVFKRLWSFRSPRAVHWIPRLVKLEFSTVHTYDVGTFPPDWPANWPRSTSAWPLLVPREQLPEIERYASTLDKEHWRLFITYPYPHEGD